ncbi:MAG: DUF3313 domain-containing protein [Ramlibacter sp.]
MNRTAASALVAILALLGACQSTPENTQSGFLRDYSQLQPAPDREGVNLYIDRSFDFRPFTKLMFDPVQLQVTPGPDQAQLAPDVQQRITGQFMQSLQASLAPAYQIVNQPGPDVLRVRSAITNIEAVKPGPGAVDFLPIKAIYNVGREAAGAGPRVAEMKAEVEVLSPNGQRVMAATATRRGDDKLPQGDTITWESLQPITDYWAKNFRSRLDEVRGTAAAPAAANH